MMGRLHKDEKGFGAVEVILVLVIVGLIGAVGFMVYRSHHKTPVSSVATSTTAKKTTSAKANTPATPITSGPQSGWSTYTNNTVGFSIAYPDTVQGDNGCATPSTVSIGAIRTSLVDNAPNYYIAAKNSIRFNLTWGANQTYYTSGCTQVPTDATSVQAQNSQIKTGAQYEYSVVNLPFFVKKVSSESAVQTELQSYWNDSTITISGWQNSSSGSYEVPAAISCAPSEMGMGNDCGPLSSNHDLRYYPTQKIMFYYVQGQAAHLSLPGNAPVPDGQVVSSFKVLN
jgi:Flp pilus assembly pilin Flp